MYLYMYQYEKYACVHRGYNIVCLMCLYIAGPGWEVLPGCDRGAGHWHPVKDTTRLQPGGSPGNQLGFKMSA